MSTGGGEPRPTVGIVSPQVLEEAFIGDELGDFGLTAYPKEVVPEDHPIHAAPELARSFLRVTGDFVDRAHRHCGLYHRFLYWHAESGEREVWLHWMAVDADRRGGLLEFRRRTIEVLASGGVRRARGTGGGTAGAYVLAREGFELDLPRLPGFGAGVGLAQGDETSALPRQGDLVAVLVERIVVAAVFDGRISEAEADLIREHEPRSPQQLAAFTERHLSRRLLATARYPSVLEM